MLTITFTSGSMLFLNISLPHKIYTRTVSWPAEPKKAIAHINGIQRNGQSNSTQLFAQSNGQLIEVSGDLVTTKSVWEYFIDKE